MKLSEDFFFHDKVFKCDDKGNDSNHGPTSHANVQFVCVYIYILQALLVLVSFKGHYRAGVMLILTSVMFYFTNYSQLQLVKVMFWCPTFLTCRWRHVLMDKYAGRAGSLCKWIELGFFGIITHYQKHSCFS